MKKILLLGSVFLLAELIGATSAEAAARKGRPWFSGERRVETPQKARRQVIAKKQTRRSITEFSPTPKSHSGHKIVQQAQLYQGTRYVFGGESKRKGVDCSGLIASVWKDLELKKIPRSSSALYQAGTPVRLAELQEGDLVFFKNTYKRGISHVGVYAGKNKFIHAPGDRKRVSITRLSDPYYQLHYAGARRLH